MPGWTAPSLRWMTRSTRPPTGDVISTSASSTARRARALEPAERGLCDLQLVVGDARAEFGARQILAQRALLELGAFDCALGGGAGSGQPALARGLARGELERGARAFDAGMRLAPRRGRARHARFGLCAAARVEQRRRQRQEPREHGAGLHRIAGVEIDAREVAEQRRRHDVAILHARHAVFVDRDLQWPAAHLGGIDRNRFRHPDQHEPEQRGQRQHHEQHAAHARAAPALALARRARFGCGARLCRVVGMAAARASSVASSCHSLLFSTPIRSRRSTRRRTASALASAAPIVTATANA